MLRDEADLIPKGAEWVHSEVAEFKPDDNAIITKDGKKINYQWLVVCPGIQINWSKVSLFLLFRAE